MKILFVGDPHLDSLTPLSRLDNYRELTLEKLNSLLELALEHKAEHIIMTGDMFENLDQSLIYLHKVIDTFKKIKDSGITVWSIIGNHDIPRNNMDYFDTSPLSLLFKSGVVRYLPSIEGTLFGEFTAFGLDFTKKDLLSTIQANPNTKNLLIMHYASDNTIPYESINQKDLSQFDLVISGHDHQPYPEIKGKPVILRPGSFTRRTKDDYNLIRPIVIYMLDTTTSKISKLNLPNVKPAEEVFKNEVFTDSGINFYKEGYGELFTKDFFESDSTSLEEIIKELPETIFEETKKEIIKFMKSRGVIKEGV